MLLSLGVAIILLGAISIIIGLRSKVVLSHSNECRRCGYDLTGASQPLESRTPFHCPECGDAPLGAGAGVSGGTGIPLGRLILLGAAPRHRYPGQLVVGILLTSLGFFIVFGTSTGYVQRFQWRTIAPVWALAWEAEHFQGQPASNAALSELTRRDSASQLSRSQHAYLARIGLRMQQSVSRTGERRWTDFIARAIEFDALSPQETIAYLKGLVSFQSRATPSKVSHAEEESGLSTAILTNIYIDDGAFPNGKAYAYEIFDELAGESRSIGFLCVTPRLRAFESSPAEILYPLKTRTLSLTLRPTAAARQKFSAALLESGFETVCPEEIRLDLQVTPEPAW